MEPLIEMVNSIPFTEGEWTIATNDRSTFSDGWSYRVLKTKDDAIGFLFELNVLGWKPHHLVAYFDDKVVKVWVEKVV